MGVFTRSIRIFNPRNGRAREIAAVIDTGSDLCQIPETLAADLDIPVSGHVDTKIASGEITYETFSFFMVPVATGMLYLLRSEAAKSS